MKISKKKFKYLLILFAILIIAIVSFFYPEYTETVSRAFIAVITLI